MRLHVFPSTIDSKSVCSKLQVKTLVGGMRSTLRRPLDSKMEEYAALICSGVISAPNHASAFSVAAVMFSSSTLRIFFLFATWSMVNSATLADDRVHFTLFN